MPVQVDEVLAKLKIWGVKDDIWFFDVDIDSDILKGQITHWESPWNDGSTKRFAHIETAKSLPRPEKRLVQCKELLHLLDPEWSYVDTKQKVRALIQRIIIPPELQDPYDDGMAHANSDRVAMLHAVAVLFPWQVRQLLMPHYPGVFSAKHIATEIVDLPEKYIVTVMSETWAEIHTILVRD